MPTTFGPLFVDPPLKKLERLNGDAGDGRWGNGVGGRIGAGGSEEGKIECGGGERRGASINGDSLGRAGWTIRGLIPEKKVKESFRTIVVLYFIEM